MESLKMPWNEVEATYTRSELGVLAWRSQEIGYQMERPTSDRGRRERTSSRVAVADQPIRQLDEFERQEKPGSDQMTEAEALQFFANMGISFPMPLK